MRKRSLTYIVVLMVIAAAVSFLSWVSSRTFARLFPVLEYTVGASRAADDLVIAPPPAPAHIETPEPVKAIYMSSWVAGTPNFRSDLTQFIRNSEINAIVIDVKDSSGKIAFDMDDQVIDDIGAEEIRVRDMGAFMEDLHRDGVYVIARIAVFEDPHLANAQPQFAIKRWSGAPWKDRKGLSWVDPASRDVWEYAVRVGRAAERAGFDELNYDYVRFPSDGNMSDMVYPVWDGIKPKSDVIEEFFIYLRNGLLDVGVPISADIFGLTTIREDDMNIGQILEKIAPHVDYIAPMVYPSHYPTGFNGFQNPAAYPYEIIYEAMTRASERLQAASSTPLKLRPWIQDFDLGADYTAEMVNKQKQAIYDTGLMSWMAWDAKNVYTKEAY